MNEPIFKKIFGADWDRLPPVMKKHYANRAFTAERVTVTGVMDIESSLIARLLTPFFRLAGTLVPYAGKNIPVTVRFISTADSDAFTLDRTFAFPSRPYRFVSRMKPTGGNEMIEYMRFGLGWHLAYRWEGARIILEHRGYILDLFGLRLPLPIGLLLGTPETEEHALDDDSFSMQLTIRHPLWGKVYSYGGSFRITALP